MNTYSITFTTGTTKLVQADNYKQDGNGEYVNFRFYTNGKETAIAFAKQVMLVEIVYGKEQLAQ